MEQAITNLVGSLGYGGIVILMIIEVVFPLLPSELILPAAGFAAASGKLWLPAVILIASIGATLGSTVIYAVAHAVPDATIYRLVEKYGKWFAISTKDVKKADAWFDRNAILAVFICRMIPGMRTVISLPAGLSKMHPVPFMIATFLGTLIWTTLMVTAGYVLGDQYEKIGQLISWFSYIVVAVVFGVIGYFIYHRRHDLKRVLKKGRASR